MVDQQEAQVNYQDHLQLDMLLNAQIPLSNHPEEMFFVIIHQAYELWFKVLILDLERIIAHLALGLTADKKRHN